jgi:hypothetical protein
MGSISMSPRDGRSAPATPGSWYAWGRIRADCLTRATEQQARRDVPECRAGPSVCGDRRPWRHRRVRQPSAGAPRYGGHRTGTHTLACVATAARCMPFCRRPIAPRSMLASHVRARPAERSLSCALWSSDKPLPRALWRRVVLTQWHKGGWRIDVGMNHDLWRRRPYVRRVAGQQDIVTTHRPPTS